MPQTLLWNVTPLHEGPVFLAIRSGLQKHPHLTVVFQREEQRASLSVTQITSVWEVNDLGRLDLAKRSISVTTCGLGQEVTG